MSDDIIRVQLVLNPQSATNIENQVRNIINRLNSQRITLTFNTSTITNCITQLERLEQTARRIQNSNINISASLNETQQTYRLETERIRAMTEQQRIAQQITVERERTLQTENRAVQALASENRTLTVNRNITEQISGNVQHTHEHIRNAGNATNDFVAHLGRGLQHLIQYRIFSELLNKFAEGFQELKATDSAMVSLKKVTDETDEKYNQFLDSAREKADRLARSVSSVVDQTARWAKLGFNTDDAAILSETSSIYANVGEVDDETAVSDIVTAMKAFNIEAKDSIQIIDKLNNLGNKYALSSADLGEGLSKAASALKFAGNDINQTLAMITGGTEIVQDASIMGNALKVLSMRIRGMKGELEELGEEYENVESISKIQTQILNLTHGDVNIFDDNGNFRSTYNILEDIAEVWERISQTDQAALLETIAGKQRGNQISALIQSFQSGQAQKAYADAINSSGSALKEQERWLDSIEAKQQKVSTAWANYIASMSDVELIKGTLDLLASAIDALDTPVGRLISQMVLVNTALALTGRLWNGIRARSIIADTLAVGIAEGSLGTAIGLVTEQLWAQTTAFLASPLGMATVAALGIYGIVKAVEYFNVSLEESREALSNLKSEYSNIKSELQGLNDELQTTQQRIAELESKDKLTFTEVEELNNLRKQNNELERQKDLLEIQQRLKARETNKAFVETMSKDVDVTGEYHLVARTDINGNATGEYYDEIFKGRATAYNDLNITEQDYILRQFKDLEKLRSELSVASTQQEKERLDKQISDIQDYLSKKNTEWQTDSEGIEYITSPQNEDEEKVNEWLDFINDFQDRMAIAMGGTDAKTNAFNRLVDNWKFDETLQGLQDLGKQGKVTAEMLKDPAYSNFIQKLIDIGFISGRTDQDLEQVANAFNGVGASVQDARKELTKYAEAKNGVIAKKLNTEDDIRQLIALANAAGASADALNRLEIMKQNLAPGASREAKIRGNYTKRQIEEGTFNWGFVPLKAEDYIDNSGGSSSGDDSSKSSTDKDKPDKADPTAAIINRIGAPVEALERQGEIIDNQLDMVDAEKEYDKYVELTNKALDNRLKTIEASKTAQSELSKEAQKVRDKYKGIDIESFFDADGDFTEAYYQHYNSLKSKTEQEAFANNMKMIQDFKKAWFEYYDEIMGLEKEAFDLRKELQEAHYDHLSDLIDQLERHADLREKQAEDDKEHYDYLITKEQALLDIKKAQFDLENKLTSARREAEKALASSKIGSEYLDEETRKLVYNEDDYKLEMDKIDEISDYVEGLTEDYIADINALGEDEMYKAEEITAQYERRIALKEKELEIVQAEVDLQKKQDTLNNVLAEKNIRQIVDGKWVWTHDTDQLRQATEDLADAEAQVEQLKREKEQLEYTNSLEARIGKWQLEQEAIDLAMEHLQDKIDEFSTKVELLKDPLENFADIVNELNAELGHVNIGDYSSSSSSSSGSSSGSGRWGSVDPNANVGSVVQQMMDNSTKWHVSDSTTKAQLHATNQSLAASIGADYNPANGKYYQNGVPLYDGGGVLKGLGGIKATKEDEIVLSPSITSKILDPEKNALFDKFTNNLGTLFDFDKMPVQQIPFNIPQPNLSLLDTVTNRNTVVNQNIYNDINITEANDIDNWMTMLTNKIKSMPIPD